MLSQLIGNSLDEVHASVDALWERLGIDDEQLAKGFNEFAIDGQRAMRLDAAGLRAGVDGTQNIELAQRNGTHNDTTNDKKERNTRAFNQALTATEIVQRTIEAIDIQIESLRLEITEIDERRAAIAERRPVAQQELKDAVEQGDALAESLAQVDRDQRALIAADTPEAIEAAQASLVMSREAAELRVQEILGESATLTDAELASTTISARILELSQEISSMDVEDASLSERRDELTAEIDQLLETRNALSELDPEKLANGEYTREQIMSLMPQGVRSEFIEDLTSKIQRGWEYTQEVAQQALDTITSVAGNALEAVGLGRLFNNATADVTPETLEPAQVAQAPTPAPVLQTNTI